jgi:hypothetical protein
MQTLPLRPLNIVPLAQHVGSISNAPGTLLQALNLLPAASPVPLSGMTDTLTYFDMWRYSNVVGQAIGDSGATGMSVSTLRRGCAGLDRRAPHVCCGARSPRTAASCSQVMGCVGLASSHPRSVAVYPTARRQRALPLARQASCHPHGWRRCIWQLQGCPPRSKPAQLRRTQPLQGAQNLLRRGLRGVIMDMPVPAALGDSPDQFARSVVSLAALLSPRPRLLHQDLGVLLQLWGLLGCHSTP